MIKQCLILFISNIIFWIQRIGARAYTNTFIWQRNTRNHTKTSCIKIIKLKRINNTREQLNGPSFFAEFPPLCFAESPLLQATKAMPPNAYEPCRDSPKTSPLWCFTHKVERRVICVLARIKQSLTIKNNFGYGRKEENNFSSSNRSIAVP